MRENRLPSVKTTESTYQGYRVDGVISGLLNVPRLLCSFALGGKKSEKYLEVIELAEYIKESSERVSLCFQNQELIYSSVVTAVNAKHGVLVIDELSSEIPSNLLKKGKIIKLHISRCGEKLSLKCQFIGELLPNGLLGYQLKLPDTIQCEASH